MDYTDPPDMPADERMTDAEFRMVRESLGFTGECLARFLDVNPRTVRAWEQGRDLIPDGVRLAMEELETVTADFAHALYEELRRTGRYTLVTYRDDEEYRAHPEAPRPAGSYSPAVWTLWPASWHRAVAARVAEAMTGPGLSVVYPPRAGGRDG